MDFPAAPQSYRSRKQLLRPLLRQPPSAQQSSPPAPRVKCYYHSAKLTRTKDSRAVSRRYRRGSSRSDSWTTSRRGAIGLRNNELWKSVLFVIVNDRSRYCLAARECLFFKGRKKKREGRGGGGRRSVYSRVVDESILAQRCYSPALLEIFVSREFSPLSNSNFQRRFQRRIESGGSLNEWFSE